MAEIDAGASVRDEVLSPLFFGADDLKAGVDCDPIEVFKHPKFRELLGSEHLASLPLFERFFDNPEGLTPEDLKQLATAFKIALLTWHRKITWLERNVTQAKHAEGAKPFDPSDFIRVVTNAATQFVIQLQETGFKFAEDVRINDEDYRSIINGIERIHERVVSVVKISKSPTAKHHHAKNLGGMGKLNTVGEFDLPPLSADLFFGGSKRSDLACCTNGNILMDNLKSIELDKEKFDILNCRISGKPSVLVVPRGAQGIIGLKDLFAEIGVLLDEDEVSQNPDVFFLGVPDEVFEGVEGVVQGKDGGQKEVSADYKRFHHTSRNGAMTYVVGAGKDGEGRELDYFGPFKKALFQMVATRQLQEATEILARTGREVTQPEQGRFKYPAEGRQMTDAEAFAAMTIPFHGTTLFWGRAGRDMATTIEDVDNNYTHNHTIFEGQSGMGKSEMEQFVRVMMKSLRVLFDVMKNHRKKTIKGQAAGLTNVQSFRLFSAGDDMGQLQVSDNPIKGLCAVTHEKGRFTRLDNLVSSTKIVARKTLPLAENGTVTETTNSRVIQVDDELESLHQQEMAARLFVLSTNQLLNVEGVEADACVQQLADLDTYMQCYGEYANVPNGTKDSDDPVKSTGAIHEFAGQFATAGGAACENLVATRRFMLEKEIARRDNVRAPKKVKFYLINTGQNPEWIQDQEIQARLAKIKDPKKRNTEMQKIRFANAAANWCRVDGLLPEGIDTAFQYAEDVLGINLGRLSYESEHWSEAQLRKYFEQMLGD